MTAEEIYIKLRDELTAENDSSSSPERIFIKSDGQTICTLGMNRSHEIIFVEFKPSAKDLPITEKESYVHPHPVEMLHDAGWRQAQLTTWEEAEKLLEIINRSYKKRKKSADEAPSTGRRGRKAAKAQAAVKKEAAAHLKREKKQLATPAKKETSVPKKAKVPETKSKPARPVKAKPGAKAKPKPKVLVKAKVKVKEKPKKAAKKKR